MVDDRKARIMELASRAKLKRMGGEENTTGDMVSHDKNALKFRNYNLSEQGQTLSKNKDAEFGTNAETTLKSNSKKRRITDGGDKVKSELELALIEAKRQIAVMGKENNRNNNIGKLGKFDAANLAPNKVNRDLKRDIEAKINKLERKTQKAIVELLRERLEREAEEDDLD